MCLARVVGSHGVSAGASPTAGAAASSTTNITSASDLPHSCAFTAFTAANTTSCPRPSVNVNPNASRLSAAPPAPV